VALRRFFGMLVEDVITQARRRLAELQPVTAMDIRQAGRPMVRFSDDIWEQLQVTRDSLYHRMYRAPDVVKMRRKVTRAVDGLFPLFMQRTDLLPKQWRKDVEEARGEEELARIVADYIAGMTDRFALQEWKRLKKG
jgi:dGTPase